MTVALIILGGLVALYLVAAVAIAAWWLALSAAAARANLYRLDGTFWATWLWRSATWPAWWRGRR